MRLFVLFVVLALAGCTTAPARVEYQQVKVAVPVECREPVPERPIMPTEWLKRGVTLDAFARAAIAEIERREGYELQLLTALNNCRAPVTSSQQVQPR